MMRLIDTKDFKLKKFEKNEIPTYAILSHTWYTKEIEFDTFPNVPIANLTSPQAQDQTKNPSIYKIAGMLTQAQNDGYDWIWIDSCCINKKDPSERDRSINSMFRWYKNAASCYVFLADVTWAEDSQKNFEAFRKSRWFSRGWTLQELLASPEAKFFDRNWKFLGTKEQLKTYITIASGIKSQYLDDFKEASVATRMSWISGRNTKEEEDLAYCMIGVFGISLGVIYGEGLKLAFRRLQEAIIKSSPDESIFAWTSENLQQSGLLAPSPACFRDSRDVIFDKKNYCVRGSYSMENVGLKFPAPTCLVGSYEATYPQNGYRIMKKTIDLSLQCWRVNPSTNKLSAIVIRLHKEGQLFHRNECDKLFYRRSPKLYHKMIRRYISRDVYISQDEIYKPSSIESKPATESCTRTRGSSN
jgi:Heterokaryon incompatibility protein (HET)